MERKYYEILGISPNSTINDIQRAYRVLAKKHHPDMGGVHEKMIELNEAWQVLSNPNLRKEYDFALNNKDDFDAQYSANKNSNRARDKAAQYPKTWSEFEFWLNSMTKDFKNAEYGTFSGPGSIPFPTAGKSFSGWLFIIAGVVAGAFFTAFVVQILDIDSNGILFKILGLTISAIGGWLGLIIHAFLGQILHGENKELF